MRISSGRFPPIDEAEELKKFKWVLIVGIVFLVSACYSWVELKYLIWGQTVDAQVTNSFIATSTGRRGRKSEKLAVEYTFADSAAGPRSERDDVSTDWPVPVGTVSVQYLPGVPDSSRLSGHTYMLAVWMLMISLILLVAFVVHMHRESNAVPGKRRPGRRLQR